MEFKINRQFAESFNRYRQLEEYEKLKAKHGDIKLSGHKVKNQLSEQADDTLGDDDSTDSDSTSSSSSSDSDNSWYEKEHEDFLNLYRALCTNDPSLDDPNKQWFRDPSDKEIHQNSDKSKSKKSDKKLEIKLRDFQQEFLLKQGGLEDEQLAKDANCVAKTESEDILRQMSSTTENKTKLEFLNEVEEAFALVNSNSNDNTQNSDVHMGRKRKESKHVKDNELDFLQKRSVKDNIGKPDSRGKSASVDFDDLSFTNSDNPETESFLRDYFLNQRWRRRDEHKNLVPSYTEVLQQSGLQPPDDEQSVNGNNSNSTEPVNNLLHDENFLVKVNDFDRARLKSIDESNDLFSSVRKSQFRFQEEDTEFIKTYPRHIQSSIGESINPTSKRAVKRRTRKELKDRAKKAKLAELERLRQLKLINLVDKIERIKKSCGPIPTADSAFNIDALCKSFKSDDHQQQQQQKHEQQQKQKKATGVTAIDIADYLEKDWDPDEHDKLVYCMFGESYHNDVQELEKPQFSDDDNDDGDSKGKDNEDEVDGYNDDLNGEQIGGTVAENSSKFKNSLPNIVGKHMNERNCKRKRTKSALDPNDYADYEPYFDDYYKMYCEDIITGATPDTDVHCRFQYRQVMPNDYGLTTEELLKADVKELNRWLPLSRITAYRTDAEEEHDKEIYHSSKQLKKKPLILHSLYVPDSCTNSKIDKESVFKENVNDPTITTVQAVKNKRRRRRKKKTGSIEQIVDHTQTPIDAQTVHEATNSKHHLTNTNHSKSVHNFNGVTISHSRLQAAGVTSKEVYRIVKKKTG